MCTILRLRGTEHGMAKEQEEGTSDLWIGYDGILHSAGDILDISLHYRKPGGSRALGDRAEYLGCLAYLR